MRPSATGLATSAIASALLLLPAPGEGRASRFAPRVCATVASSQWTSTVNGRITHGRRYRVVAERLPCLVAVRLAEQLIPLGTSAAFAERRPVGYVCIPLGRGTNRFRPASAVGLCLQKPVASGPERSFSWRPAA
jgi:hypothetical protein